MKQPSVDEIVGHGSITEYDRALDRIRRRSLWMRVGLGVGHLAVAGLNWQNPMVGLWVAIAYYQFWKSEDWMVEAFTAYTRYSKDLLNQIERMRTTKRKLYE